MVTDKVKSFRSESESSHQNNRTEDVDRSDIVSDLRSRIDGEVRFDSYSRQLYATDASAYEATPIGVVFPTSTEEVATVVKYCAKKEIPILPRGGGTSLAGQTVNEAIVLDFTKAMDNLLTVKPEKQMVTAQPGVTLGDMNAELAEDNLKFAPDPAWGDKSTLGGAIGNNSTGSHSLVYGKTDAYIQEVEAVLADGTVTKFGKKDVQELREEADPNADGLLPQIYSEIVHILDEETEEIRRRYPRLKRNVSGYSLDVLVEEAESGTINLARLLAGSEGTLAIITEITVKLEFIPETKAVALLTYVDLLDALRDVEPVLAHNPAAVEVMDDVLLDLARDTAEFSDVVEMLPEGTDSVLLVEFYAESAIAGRQKVANLIADRVSDVTTEVEPTTNASATTDTEEYALTAMEAHDESTRKRFWKMRKSGLPILLGRTTDAKHISFIEDTAVPAENLPNFIADFREVLNEHDTFASYYAHAGPGVLHIRPLINTKTTEGIEAIESIADEVTDLVVKYDGSISGEHGDGRARTQWNRKLYGEDLWQVFRDLKSAYDPNWLLNPGQICGDVDMTENLRFDPSYEFEPGFDTALEWRNENGFQGMVELCHGCGGCRGSQETTGGVMCPTYRASQEEIQTTRGRANLLRQAMNGSLSEEEQFDVEFMHRVMDMCIGCKGCERDCPSEVDMAKLKAEITHEYHERHGSTFRDRLFANFDHLASIGSTLAPLSNWGTKVPGSRTLLEKAVGIASERSLPTFQRESFEDWFSKRGGSHIPIDEANRKVLLFPDSYTNYNHPETGKAAVRVLEAANIHVQIPEEVVGSGRPPFSKGFLDKARANAKTNVDTLTPYIDNGWEVVVVEPSDAVMLKSDYCDLLDGESVKNVATNTYGIMEYIDIFGIDGFLTFNTIEESLTYHGHCHQTAIKKEHHAVGVLRRAGYEVDPLDSTCCGMAGSFGYEKEHYSMSMAIGRILYDQVKESGGEVVVASGASCRTQLGECVDNPVHPIQKIATALT